LAQDNPNASIIIQGIGQCFLGIMLLVVLFGPKLYYIASGKANDKKMLEVATSTGTKGASGRKGSAPVTKTSSGSKPSAVASFPAPTSTSATTKSSNTSTVPSNAGTACAGPPNTVSSSSSIELFPVTSTCASNSNSIASNLFSSMSIFENALSTYTATYCNVNISAAAVSGTHSNINVDGEDNMSTSTATTVTSSQVCEPLSTIDFSSFFNEFNLLKQKLNNQKQKQIK
jgi:hypothetical protein